MRIGLSATFGFLKESASPVRWVPVDDRLRPADQLHLVRGTEEDLVHSYLSMSHPDILQLVDRLQKLDGPLSVLHRRGGLLSDDAIEERLATDVLHEGDDVVVQLEDFVNLGEVGRLESACLVCPAHVAKDTQGGGEKVRLVAARALLQVTLLGENCLLLFTVSSSVELIHPADDNQVFHLEAGRLNLRHRAHLLGALCFGEVLHVARLIGHVHSASGGDVLVLSRDSGSTG